MERKENVREWYLKNYPTDELGERINPKITFSNVHGRMVKKVDIYDVIGVGDSIVRERIMARVADLYYGGSYDKVYNLWLRSA